MNCILKPTPTRRQIYLDDTRMAESLGGVNGRTPWICSASSTIIVSDGESLTRRGVSA